MRIAMLGLGFMGGVHLRALREVAGATVAAVFSNDERQLTGDLSATQGNLGRAGGRLAFSAVKHVLVEKPMALEGAGARRMIAEAERAGRILMCAHALRFFPEYVALRH